MERGIVLAQHYAGEALRLFQGAKIDADLRHAARLLDWLHQSWKEAKISLPDIYQPRPQFDRETEKRPPPCQNSRNPRLLVKLPAALSSLASHAEMSGGSYRTARHERVHEV